MAKNMAVVMCSIKSAFENGSKKLQPVLSVCVNFLLMIIRLNLIELKRGTGIYLLEYSGTLYGKIFFRYRELQLADEERRKRADNFSSSMFG